MTQDSPNAPFASHERELARADRAVAELKSGSYEFEVEL